MLERVVAPMNSMGGPYAHAENLHSNAARRRRRVTENKTTALALVVDADIVVVMMVEIRQTITPRVRVQENDGHFTLPTSLHLNCS